MKKAWLNEMVAVKAESLHPDDLEAAKKALTVAVRTFKGKQKVQVFKEEDGWFWLPRRFGFSFLRRRGFKFKDERYVGDDLPFEVDWDLLDQPPYPPDQSVLVKTVVAKAKRNAFGGFAVAPTASGKTLMGSYIGALLGGPTLIIVHKSDLIKNWRRSISEHVRIDGKPPRIGEMRKAVCNHGPMYPFVIGMVQSIAQKNYAEKAFRSFRTVIFDECVTGDALLETDKGVLRIDSLEQYCDALGPRSGGIDRPWERECRGLSVASYDGGKKVFRPVKQWMFLGRKPCLRIRAGERELKVTETTLLWTDRGWVRARNLKRGDHLCLDIAFGQTRTDLGAPVGAETAFRCQRESRRIGWGKVESKDIGNAIRSAPDTTGEEAHLCDPTCEGRSSERYSGTSQYCTRTDALSSQDSVSLMGPRSTSGLNIRSDVSRPLRSPQDFPNAPDMGSGASLELPLAPPRSSMCLASRTPKEEKRRSRSRARGSIKLTSEGAFGGTSTTGVCVEQTGKYPSTRKDIQEQKTSASQSGSRISGTNAKCQEQRSTTTFGSPRRRVTSFTRITRSSSPLFSGTRFQPVTCIEPIGHLPVYDLTVEDTHAFFANGILAHNCHHIPAETFLSVAYRFAAKYLIGVTATLRRKDGSEKVFAYAIGDVLYEMKRVRVEGKVYFRKVPFLINGNRIMAGGRVSPSMVAKAFSNLDYRNDRLLKEIVAAYKAGRKNLVLSHTREHLAVLYERLPTIVRRRSGFYVGGRKEAQLDRVAQKQILLGTYGMAYEGMDVPELDMLTVATPVKDIEQPVGRILRKHPDKMNRVLVLDFVDDHKTLRKWALERRRYYQKEGFKLEADFVG